MSDISEDIKILEEYRDDELFGVTGRQALENLLARYKQLEQANEKKTLKIIEYDKTLEKLQKETIWKSKVKEKIEEINGNREYLSKFNDWKEKDYTNEDIINNCIDVLEELLREE